MMTKWCWCAPWVDHNHITIKNIIETKQCTMPLTMGHKRGTPSGWSRTNWGPEQTAKSVICFFLTQNAIYYNPCSIYTLCYFVIPVTYPQGFHRVRIVIKLPSFIQQYLWNIAIQPAVGCSGLWARKELWNRTIDSIIMVSMSAGISRLRYQTASGGGGGGGSGFG